MVEKEAKARIKINKLLEESDWRFFDNASGKANIVLEPKVIGCGNEQVGEFSRFVKFRNRIAHPSGKDFATMHKYFSPMKAAGVSFYDAAAMIPVAVNAAA